MGLSPAQLSADLAELARQNPVLAEALARYGLPETHMRTPGLATLVRAIVAQQLSVKASATITARLEALLGSLDNSAGLLTLEDSALRTAGLSHQKIGYLRALATCVHSGQLDLATLPTLDDETAIAHLIQVKGLGRWTAEIYLLFAEGRRDMWPAADLAVQEGVRRLLSLDTRPTERETRRLGERWSPYRGAMALFLWHYYKASSALG